MKIRTEEEKIAVAILAMTYGELIHLAEQLVLMQKNAKEDGWSWHPNEVHGEFGLANMLHSWAESCE